MCLYFQSAASRNRWIDRYFKLSSILPHVLRIETLSALQRSVDSLSIHYKGNLHDTFEQEPRLPVAAIIPATIAEAR